MVRGISTAALARRASALAVAAAAAAVLSACGAGQVTQTDTKQSAIAGVNVDQGEVALRDVQVEFGAPGGYAAGDDAPLQVWIANEGREAISLTGVSTEAAEEVVLVAGESEAPAEEPAEDEGTETPEGEEPTDEAPAEDESGFPVEIAPSDYVRLDTAAESGAYLLLRNLAEDLSGGGAVEVVFEFSNGERVPVEIPIGQPYEQAEPDYVEHPGPGH